MRGIPRMLLLMLAVGAVLCSRAILALVHDPEGPNLPVVLGIAAILFLVSAAAYLSKLCPQVAGYKRWLAAGFIQITVATGLCLALR